MSRAGTTGGALLAALSLAAAGPAVMAQDPSTAAGDAVAGTIAANIRDGDCAAPGDVAALLEDVAAQTSTDIEATETDAASSVRVSITDVALPLTDIVAGEHVVALEDTQSGQALACGEISGTIVDDGLAVAVRSLDGSGVSGIGWLLGVGLEATRVHIFVTPADSAAEPDEPDEEPSPSPSPAAGGDGDQPDPEPEPVPDPDIDPGDDIDVDV